MDELLFNRTKLIDFKNFILKVTKEKIRSISRSDVESRSLDEIKISLLNHTIIHPVFFTEECDLEYHDAKGKKRVTRYRMFTGDARLFDIEPSISTFNPPRGRITIFEDKSVLALSSDFDLSANLMDSVRFLEQRLPDIQSFVTNVNRDMEDLNRNVSALIESELPIRYSQIKSDIDDYNNLKKKN